jgi:hypothetical protein
MCDDYWWLVMDLKEKIGRKKKENQKIENKKK